jgi:hypothetical protein
VVEDLKEVDKGVGDNDPEVAEEEAEAGASW